MQISGEAMRFLLENIEHSMEAMTRALDIIKVAFDDGKIDFSQLKLLLNRERFDFFLLVDLYYKNPKMLYEIILSNAHDMDWLRGMASSLQGHIVKVLHPTQIKLKELAKLNTYEKTVLLHHEKLNREKVKIDLEFFSELEILAKSRDQLILNHLRCKIIA